MYRLRKVMRFLTGLVFFVLSLPLFSQDKLVDTYPDLFIRAAEEGKSVMIIFDHPNCGWCRVFDHYHELPEVKEILEPEFLIYKIDISESESYKEQWEYYDYFGVPAWRIYSSDGGLISDGRNESGEQVGYPLEPEDMDTYSMAIMEGSSHITKRQLKVLRRRIVYCDKHF